MKTGTNGLPEFEQWKQTCHSQYEVSNHGRVRRLAGDHCRNTRVIRAIPDSKGYLGLTICVKGQHISRKVHHIVAEAFLGARPTDLTVNHIDGNKQNNRPENLEYVTRAENTLHAKRTGNSGKMNQKLTDAQIDWLKTYWCKRKGKGRISGYSLAAEWGVHPDTIYNIASGKTWNNAHK